MGELARYGALAGLGAGITQIAQNRAAEDRGDAELIREQRLAKYRSGLRREESAEQGKMTALRDERLAQSGLKASKIQGEAISARELARDERTASRQREDRSAVGRQNREGDLRERETRLQVAQTGSEAKPRFDRTSVSFYDEESGLDSEIGVATDSRTGLSYAEKRIGRDVWWVPFVGGKPVDPQPLEGETRAKLPGAPARQYLRENPGDWTEFLRKYGVLPPEFFSPHGRNTATETSPAPVPGPRVPSAVKPESESDTPRKPTRRRVSANRSEGSRKPNRVRKKASDKDRRYR